MGVIISHEGVRPQREQDVGHRTCFLIFPAHILPCREDSWKLIQNILVILQNIQFEESYRKAEEKAFSPFVRLKTKRYVYECVLARRISYLQWLAGGQVTVLCTPLWCELKFLTLEGWNIQLA